MLLGLVAVTVNLSALSYLTGTVMPLLTGLVTHLDAAPRLKAVVNLVLSLAAGVIAAFVAHQGTLDIGQIITAAVQAYVASGVAYLAFWKPTGVAPAVNATGLNIGKPTGP